MPRKKRDREQADKPPIPRAEASNPRRSPPPPRIDALPEAIANVVLNAGCPKGPVSGKAYYCVDCGRQVSYPETLYQDGRCEQCHYRPLD